MSISKPTALYIHIPFCDYICGYCDFTRFGYVSDIADRYLMRLADDLKRVDKVDTIYIGGGTPTSLSLGQLKFLFESIKHLIKDATEITIEANPESIIDEKIDLLLKYGINRVSLGVQSSDDAMLKSLGREHDFNQVLVAIERLRNRGINNISCDFMYGLPHQTLENVKEDLSKILSIHPVHLSLYALTIEPHSAFGRQKIKPAPVELETEMYLYIVKTLKEHGFIHYEISNFCQPNHDSKHNQVYWSYGDFYGIGIGASGKENHQRYTVTTNLNTYLNRKNEYYEVVELNLEDEMMETMMMGLRTQWGVNKQLFTERYNTSIEAVYYEALKPFFEQGLLVDNENYVYATEKGRLILNDILVEIV